MKKTAKSSKTIRANKRKAKLKAKHRRQRARATGYKKTNVRRGANPSSNLYTGAAGRAVPSLSLAPIREFYSLIC